MAVKKARRKAQELEEECPSLTEDERAMITLYTMELNPKEGSIYFAMNQALRERDREAVKIWKEAIWLLLTAMKKLPRVEEKTLYRGVRKASSELGECLKIFFFCHTFSSFSILNLHPIFPNVTYFLVF